MLRPASALVTALLTALTAVGSFSISIYTPSMPALTADLATTTDRVKLTLSVFLVGFGLGQLAYGPLSDRFGRRITLLGGLALYVLGNIACAVAPTINVMIAARFVQALGACAGPVLGRAVVRDVHGREGTARVLAWIATATALSPAIGPTIGGHVHVWFGWRANFLLLTVLGALLLLAVWRGLGETNSRPDEQATSVSRMAINYAMLLQNREYLAYLLCGSFLIGGLFAYIAAAPFLFIDQLGIPPDHYGLLSIFTTAAYMVGTVIAARLNARAPIERMVRIGAAVALVGALTMLPAALLDPSVPGILAPMMVFGIGIGIALPNCLAGGMGPFPGVAGAASALLGFAQMLAAAGATVAVAALPQQSALSLTVVLFACSVVAVLSVARPSRPAST
jgi:DHA1 family bicyclomycin/chloramphenicol resistance-like MFS transporter